MGQVGKVFTNGPGDMDSIPGCVIPKTLKWYLIPPCLKLTNIRYVSRAMWSNPGKGVATSSTPRCCSYWIGSLLVALDYGCQLYNMVSINYFYLKAIICLHTVIWINIILIQSKWLRVQVTILIKKKYSYRISYDFQQIYFTHKWDPNSYFAQSAGAVEYTKCISTEGLNSHNEYPGYDKKQSDGQVPVMQGLWGMQSFASLPSLPDPLRLRVIAPDRVLSMGQIELNYVPMLNWITWNRTVLTFNCVNRKYTCTKLICLK